MSDTAMLRLITATGALVIAATAIMLFSNYQGATPSFGESADKGIQHHWSLIDQLKRARGAH